MESKLIDKIKQDHPLFESQISDDFIGVFDNVFTKDYCNSWIERFEKAHQNGISYNRLQAFKRPAHANKDESVDYANLDFYVQDDIKIECHEFNRMFWQACYPLYTEKYSVLSEADQHKIYVVKLQKTQPQGGYHMWHFESATRPAADRLMVFNVYLNDVEEGGETEFLYLSKRVQAKAGRLVIFPAAYTHTHRGNPPLNRDKYILTGWVEF